MIPKTLDNLFFKTAVHQCNDFVVITDADSLILYVNPSFEIHTGYKLKSIKGKNISIVKSGLHNNTFYKKLWSNLKKGNPVSQVFINKKKNGELYYENKTITPIKNEKGKIEFYLSTSKDFTKEYTLKKEVIDQNNFIQSIVKNTDALIVGLDIDANIVLFNSACEKLTGYKFADVKGKNVINTFIPKQERKAAQDFFKNISENRRNSKKHINTWLTKNKKELLIKWSSTYLQVSNSDGLFLLCTGIDVTKEKENEDKLIALNNQLDEKVKARTNEIRQLNKEILLKNNLLHKINSNLPAIVYYLNVKTKKITLINNKINDTVLFPFDNDVCVDFKDFVSHFNCKSNKAISIKQFLDEKNSNEYAINLHKENYYLQHKTVVFEFDKNNKPNVYLGVLTDVTYLKTIQHRLEESQGIAHIGTWDWNVQTNELYWTDEIYRIFELDPKNFKPSYTTFLEIIHQEDRELLEEAVHYAVKNNKPYELTHRLETQPGKIKYVIENGMCHYDEHGIPTHMIGTVRDITEVEYTKKRLEEAQNLAQIGTWEFNRVTNEFYSSIQMYDIYELDSSKNLITIDYLVKHIHPEDMTFVIETPNKAAQNRDSYFIEYRIITDSNKIKYVSGRGYAEYSSSGEVIKLLGSVQDITREKTLQNKLLNYYATLENSLSAIFTNDFDSKIEYANPSAIKMWGYESLEEMLKDKPYVYNYWHPDDVSKVSECLKLVLTHGFCSSEKPYKAIKKNGEIALIKFNLSLIKDVNNNPISMTGSFYDVTEELKIKKEIEESDKKLQSLLSNIDEIVYGIDFEEGDMAIGNLFFVSGKSKEIIGYSAEEFKSCANLWYTLIHPDDVQSVFESTMEAINLKKSVIRAYRMKHGLTGEYRWFEDKFTPDFDRDGNLKLFYGSASDVTTRKNLEISLIENEEKYRSLYENALVGIFRTNIKTKKPVDANNVCVKIFGYDSRDDFFENFISTEHYADIEIRNSLLTKLKTNKSIENEEILFLKKDGSSFWGNTSVKLLEGGELMEGVVIDITLSKIYENQLKNNLEEKDLLIKEVHHRVKNNLQIISSLLKLQMQKHHNPILIEALTESRERVRAIALIHEKMYMSDDISTIDFCEYLKNLIKSIYALHKDRNVNLTLNFEKFVTDINVAIPLALVCYEIFSNAFKHAFKEKQEGELHVDLMNQNGKTSIKISDNGSGFIVENVDQQKSLGWSLINNLSKQAKATIDIKSKIGQGSEFIINL
ncbi:MAG: hypothetical protein C0448_01130 [Sphingobacteriaceae bacterium]|nr:hypothetical protein [Sphingobacteriaceae bacterium]